MLNSVSQKDTSASGSSLKGRSSDSRPEELHWSSHHLPGPNHHHIISFPTFSCLPATIQSPPFSKSKWDHFISLNLTPPFPCSEKDEICNILTHSHMPACLPFSSQLTMLLLLAPHSEDFCQAPPTTGLLCTIPSSGNSGNSWNAIYPHIPFNQILPVHSSHSNSYVESEAFPNSASKKGAFLVIWPSLFH